MVNYVDGILIYCWSSFICSTWCKDADAPGKTQSAEHRSGPSFGNSHFLSSGLSQYGDRQT